MAEPKTKVGQASQCLTEGHERFFSDPPNLQAAAEAYKRAAELRPDWNEPFGWLCSVLSASGDLAGALESIGVAIQLAPNDSRHWISKGVLLSRLGHHEQAVRALEEGVALSPGYGEASARLALAEALESCGNSSRARDQLQIVARMEPSYPDYDDPINEAKRKLGRHA